MSTPALPPLVEQTSALYRATLLDESGNLVTATLLSTMTLSLFDGLTLTVINTRDNQNVKGSSGVAVNGVTVWDALQNGTDQNGNPITYNLQWAIAPADAPIIDDSRDFEVHIALFKLTWGGGAKGINHPVSLPVINLVKVP